MIFFCFFRAEGTSQSDPPYILDAPSTPVIFMFFGGHSDQCALDAALFEHGPPRCYWAHLFGSTLSLLALHEPRSSCNLDPGWLDDYSWSRCVISLRSCFHFPFCFRHSPFFHLKTGHRRSRLARAPCSGSLGRPYVVVAAPRVTTDDVKRSCPAVLYSVSSSDISVGPCILYIILRH